jgi:hypothetical protein
MTCCRSEVPKWELSVILGSLVPFGQEGTGDESIL